MHIKICKDGAVMLITAESTITANVADVTMDFDDENEAGYEEHDLVDVVKTFQAMQECTKILNNMS